MVGVVFVMAVKERERGKKEKGLGTCFVPR